MKAALLAVAYLLGGMLIAPGALLAYFVWSVGQASQQGNLIKFLFFVLIRFIQTLDWAMFLVAPMVIAWAVLAFVPKYRWIGASAMTLIGLVSLVICVATTSAPKSANDISFYVLPVAGMALNIWLIWDAAPWE